jgi:predicted PurR-regulated permease PerM
MSQDRLPEPEESQPDSLPPSASWKQFWPPLSYWSKVALVVLLVVIAIRILAALQNLLLIVVAAFVISLGLQPAIRWMEERGMRRGAAMALLLLVLLAGATAAALAVVPVIIEQAAEALEEIPPYIESLQSRPGVIGDLAARLDLEGGTGFAFDPIAIVGSVVLTLFNIITLLLLTPYFAVAFPGLKSGLFRLTKRANREDFVFVVNRAVDLTSNYIVGNIVISLVAAVISFVAFLIIGLPYPLALAAWVGLMDLIPAIGALIGMIPVVAVASQLGGQELIISVIFLVLYQQFENYVVAPRVMRRAVNLNPAIVIIALLVGGSLAGLVGALLALPVAALAKVLVTEFLIRDRLETVRSEPDEPVRKRRIRGRIDSRPLP